MKSNYLKIGSLFLVFLFLSGVNQVFSQTKNDKVDPLKYVDPFIGVDGHGNVFPGAALPFSMVNLSPDVTRTESPGGYVSNVPIVGFSHNHMSGMGVKRGFGNLLVLPQTGKIILNDSATVKNEVASPGYYAANLVESGIKAELTLSAKSGVHQYTFPKGKTSRILISVSSTMIGSSSKCVASEAKFISDKVAEGQASFESPYGSSKYTIFFVAEFDKPIATTGGWQGKDILKNAKYVSGTKTGLFAEFNLPNGGTVGLQIGVSYMSLENARKNLAVTRGNSFEKNKLAAENIWSNYLNKIKIAGGTEEERKLFYTGLYRSVVVPADVTGEVQGWNPKVPHFWHIYCIWDTYHTLNPLYTLIVPQKQAELIRCLVSIQQKHGWLPDSWYANDYTHIQGGTHADIVIGDAFVKDLKGFNREEAYAAIRKNATVPGPNGREKGRYPEYFTLGYLPYFQPEKYMTEGLFDEKKNAKTSTNPTSRTLDYSRDDYAVALAAKVLGKNDDYEKFKKQSMNGWKLWNPETKFFWGRDENGKFVNGYFKTDWEENVGNWVYGFNPEYITRSWTPPLYEGSAWVYAFSMQHDVNGLIQRHGGNDVFLAFLDRYFGETKPDGRVVNHHESYNEPAFLTPWLHTYAGRPDKNVDRVQHQLNTEYEPTRKGLPGNDDGGAMSSMYVFSAMGFMPVAGQDVYLLASPLFSEITMELDKGKKFVIKTNNLSKENKYVQKATLNGKNWDKAWFQHKDIINGAVMVLEMGAKPSAWGTKIVPPSASDVNND
jgi:predicted alpha-1,2-mannosidase